jgi:hypothetical protein
MASQYAGFQSQLNSIGNQRDFTKSIMAQALAPQENQNAFTGIARILSAYLAKKGMTDLGQQEQDVIGQRDKFRRDEMSRILSSTQDRPAQVLQPGEMGPPAPAIPGISLSQALMTSQIPEFQDMGLKSSLTAGNDNTPANVAEWNYYSTLNPDQQKQYLNMKRAGFGAGGVRYTAGGDQITPTEDVAADAAAIEAAKAKAREDAEAAATRDAKKPVMGSMKYVMSQYEELFPKIKTGGPLGATGKASSIFDSQDAMRFENLNQQLSTELRTVFRIPGEGTLSDQEQRQYGLQLPSLNYDEATNRAIIKDLETRAGMRTDSSAQDSGGLSPEEQAELEQLRKELGR